MSLSGSQCVCVKDRFWNYFEKNAKEWKYMGGVKNYVIYLLN